MLHVERLKYWPGLPILLLTAFHSAQAQGLGSIVGTVVDPSGGVVTAAKIVVTDEGTSLTRETTTNTQGYYVVPSLRPATYSLSVEAQGFAAYLQKGIILQADQTAAVNVNMALRQTQQSILVEAAPPQVDTSTSTLSEVVDRQRVVELPLNGRNAASLALITAGTVLAPATADEGSTKTFPAAVTISANGSRQNQASFRLDGANNNDAYTNVNQPFPFPDALQEFSVQTSNYSARYGGNAGGVVNVVTKSGDNTLHGSLFAFNRNAVFNARDYFAARRDPLKRNQFGGTAGGPVAIPGLYHGRDRTFFFGGYQGTRIRNTALGGNSAYFPTQANLNGDFSSLLTVNPNNPIGKAVTITDPANNNTPWPNNQLPVSRYDKAALALTKYVPLGVGSGKVSYALPTATSYDEAIARIDHSIGDKDRLSGRYFYDRYYNSPFLDMTNLVNNQPYTDINSHNFMVSETHTFSATFLNDFRFSVAREVADRGPAAGSINVQDLGMQNMWQPPGAKIIESLNVSGYFQIGMTDPATFTRDQYGINDAVSLVRGSHSLTMGVDAIRAWVMIRNQFHQPGQFGFTADYNGDAMASFLLGQLRSFVQGNGEFKDNRVNSFGLFFQDDWHATRRLTLNLGVRLDPFFPWKETKGRTEIFDPNAYAQNRISKIYPNAPAGLLFPGDDGVPQYGLLANWKNFGPRVGFAYDLTGNGKTSLRGGFGLFYDALQNGIYNNRFVDVAPFSVQINYTAGGLGPFSNPYQGITNPFPNPPSTFPTPYQVVTYDTANGGVYSTPMAMNYNLSIERQLADHWLVRAAYVGSQSRHLLETQELSPAVYSGSLANANARRYFKNYGSIGLASQDIDSGYNSFQLTVQKRFSQGFTVLGNYTWSKSIDDMPYGTSVTTVGVSAAGGSSWVSPVPWYMPGRHQFDKGPSEFDHTQRLVTSFVWQLPQFGKQPRWMKYTLGGWNVNGLISAQTGGPLTVVAGKDMSGTATNNDRAYYVGGNPYGNSGCSKAPCVNYLNTAAFTLPPQGSWGNVGKGALRGPALFTWDGALTKDFAFKERVKLQFRAEFFDVVNRANFQNPQVGANTINGNGLASSGPNVSGTGFGQIIADMSNNGASSVLSPRIGQLALKLTF